MATAKEILSVARSQLGVKESPANSNNVKYNTAYYGREVHDTASAKYPWCMVFQWWVFRAAGAPELFYGGGKTASCGTLMDYAAANGQLVRSGYRPGDLVFLRFSQKRTRPEHVGLVKEVRSNGDFITIEGNTGLGNDANGGQVQQRVRYAWQVLAAYRPHYDEEEKEEEDVVTYKYLKDIPGKFRPIINDLMTAGIIQGDGSDPTGNGDVINLTHEQVRTLVFVYRGGGFDAKLRAAGLNVAVG